MARPFADGAKSGREAYVESFRGDTTWVQFLPSYTYADEILEMAAAPPLAPSVSLYKPLSFPAGCRLSQCLGRINLRSLQSSPLVIVSKSLELTRNCLIGHGLGCAEQRPCCFQIFLASLRERHVTPTRFGGSWPEVT
jgi:hypothetical protein